MLPSLEQFTKETGSIVYYYDIETDRTEENSQYQTILLRLNQYLPVDQVTQNPEDADFDATKKRVVLPHLFFLSNGQIADDLEAYEHTYLQEGDDAAMLALLMEKAAKTR